MKLAKLIEQAEKLDVNLPVLTYLEGDEAWVDAQGKQIRLGFAVKNDNGEFDVFAKPPRDVKSKPVALLGDGDIGE